MPDDPTARGMARLDAAMEAWGLWPDEDSAWVRDAMRVLARHRFAPDTVWRWDGSGWVPVDRAEDADAWAALVYPAPEESTVIQVTDGMPTSSLSCAGVVADMLDSLMLEPGQKVVELGTGAGWNAALLAHRAGPDGRVVSVEVDPVLAKAAGARLERAGVHADIRIGDGAAGAPDGGPYDRLMATYAVESVPWEWVEQVRPGGRLVFPWGRLGHFALTVDADGKSAMGWLQGLALFMADRKAAVADPAPATPGLPLGDGEVSQDAEVFADLVDDHLLFALRVSHPRVVVSVDRTRSEPRVLLRDAFGRSATVERTGGRVTVSGDGEDLWPEVRAGHRWWCGRGRPEQWAFGMTVTPAGQTVWADDPGRGPYAG
ncbi:methyltransferase domain-containing protein [Streptomyces laurentii]|uniref:methyltransferase domain-containing protein n=1 Tax=Streptomyces laurentii TaxID=39478 RepID=UPI00369F5268